MNAYQTQDYTLVRSLNNKLAEFLPRLKRHDLNREALAGRIDMRDVDRWQQNMAQFLARTMEAA